MFAMEPVTEVFSSHSQRRLVLLVPLVCVLRGVRRRPLPAHALVQQPVSGQRR